MDKAAKGHLELVVTNYVESVLEDGLDIETTSMYPEASTAGHVGGVNVA